MLKAAHAKNSGARSSSRFTTGVRKEKYSTSWNVSDMNSEIPEEHISRIGTIRQMVM